MLGQAKTGTGKTAAFRPAIPEIIMNHREIRRCQALILAPTRSWPPRSSRSSTCSPSTPASPPASHRRRIHEEADTINSRPAREIISRHPQAASPILQAAKPLSFDNERPLSRLDEVDRMLDIRLPRRYPQDRWLKPPPSAQTIFCPRHHRPRNRRTRAPSIRAHNTQKITTVRHKLPPHRLAESCAATSVQPWDKAAACCVLPPAFRARRTSPHRRLRTAPRPPCAALPAGAKDLKIIAEEAATNTPGPGPSARAS